MTPVGGVTDAEAGAIAQGVREMAHTIRGLRDDLARVERARSQWGAEVERLREAIEGYLLNEYAEGVPPNSHAAHLREALGERSL